MNAEILCIGTELLHGDIANTNAVFLSKELAKIGIDVHYHSVVGDNPTRIKESYDIALNRADVIISTGGLGPTQDDITKEIVAEYFNLPMIYDEDSYNSLISKYSKFSEEMPESNLRQTYFPEGSEIIYNPVGTANGCILKRQDRNGKERIVILLPGPPFENQPMIKNSIIPYLSKFSNSVVLGGKVIVFNLGESKAEEMSIDLVKNQSNPTIGTYASKGQVDFRITAKGSSKEKCLNLIEPVKKELLNRFKDNAIYLSADETLEESLCNMLIENNISISTAESCTGGLLASRLINYSGISKIFKEGFITYSNESKMKILKVKESTLSKFGAVSKETALEMAKGLKEKTNSDIAISITGIAGPSGSTYDKPVGLVYACIIYKENIFNIKMNRYGDRQNVREGAVNKVLTDLRNILLTNKLL